MPKFLNVYDILTTFEVIDNYDEEIIESEDKSITTVSNGAQRFEWVFRVMNYAGQDNAGRHIFGHRSKQRRVEFTFPVPQLPDVEIPTSTIQVPLPTAANTDRLPIVIPGPGATQDAVRTGTFFTLPGDRKIYMVDTGSLVSQGSNSVVGINPPLRKSVAQNAKINFTPTAYVKYGSNTLSKITITGRKDVEFLIHLIESL